MLGVLINVAAIVLGTLIGLLVKKGLPERVSDVLMQGLGLVVIVIGVQGAIGEPNVLVLIVSVVVGLAVGEALDIEDRVNRATERLTSRFVGEGQGARMAQAFVTSCLVMNVGAMTIVGSLDAGLTGDCSMLYTKSMLDFVAGIMMGASMGVGVMGSAAFTLVFQGGIVLLAGVVAPFASDAVITELTCTGSVMILAIGLNLVGITKLKVLNYLPGLVAAPLVLAAFGALGIS